MPDNHLRLTSIARRYIAQGIRENKYPGVSSPQQFASEMLGMTYDELRNRIYEGRAYISDDFIVTLYSVFRLHFPQGAQSFLQEYYIDNSITLKGEAARRKIESLDVRDVILRACAKMGMLTHKTLEHLQDGQLDLWEIDEEIEIVDKLLPIIQDHKADLLHRKADLVASGARPKPRRKTRGKK